MDLPGSNELDSKAFTSDLLSNNGTESRPLDSDVRPHLPTYVHHLHPYMFSFSIAIRPYHKGVSAPRLCLQVLLNGLLVVWDKCSDFGIKEDEGVMGLPLPVLVWKVDLGQVS